MTEAETLARILLWLLGALGTALTAILLVAVKRHYAAESEKRLELRALENTVIKSTQFNQWTQRIDKRFEQMQAHLDAAIAELRSDNREIVAKVVEVLKRG